jgi:hypothetical protein
MVFAPAITVRHDMQLKIIEAWGLESSTPLTICARSVDRAEEIYAEWVDAHHPARARQPSRLVDRDKRWLADRPQLADVTRRGDEGVVYFIDHVLGFVVTFSWAPMAGEIAPPQTEVRYFRAETVDGDGAMLFARDPDEALRLYIIWHTNAYGRLPSEFSIEEASRWRLTGPLTILREKMDASMIGVAGWTLREGWDLYPADHSFAEA